MTDHGLTRQQTMVMELDESKQRNDMEKGLDLVRGSSKLQMRLEKLLVDLLLKIGEFLVKAFWLRIAF